MNHLHYITDERGEPVEVDLMTWARWLDEQPERRIVKQQTVMGARVSTVFLGLDHNFTDNGPPILWESMIFGGPFDQEQRRYSSREAALRGHEELCAAVCGAGIQPWAWVKYWWKALWMKWRLARMR